MEKDFDLDVRVAVAPTQDTTQGFASIGSTCWSCQNSCDCHWTQTCFTVC
ncbi:FDLD family class I lanthipeptide [Streptomyces cinnamoneus]|nr:FDLD family class I lanthipeptide [Streptomyces cinnamoneus]